MITMVDLHELQCAARYLEDAEDASLAGKSYARVALWLREEINRRTIRAIARNNGFTMARARAEHEKLNRQ
jgi:hypothetical protein